MSIAATGSVPAWWSTPTASGEADPHDDVIGRHTDADMAPSEAGWGEDGFGFSDFLDIINPLQHIPGVSTVYREMTGDTIADAPRAVGGMIWGGPLGLVAAVANSITQAETGRDLGGNVVALAVGGAGDPSATDPGASMDQPSPPGSGPSNTEVHAQLAALTAAPGTLDPFGGSNPAISAALPGGSMPASVLPAGLMAAGRVASGGVDGALGGMQSFSGSAAGALDRLVARSSGAAPQMAAASLGGGALAAGPTSALGQPVAAPVAPVLSARAPAAPGSVMSAPRQILPSALSTAPSSPSSAQVRLGVPALARSGEDGDGLDPRTRAAAENLANPGAGPRAPDGTAVQDWMMNALTKYEAMRQGGS